MNAKTTGEGFAWDDLRVVLAIARRGSLAGAARHLAINHSTVFRRLGALEDRLGVRLFERQVGSYLPTPAGEDLLRSAERVESELSDLERRLVGRDLRLSGSLRVTAPDDIAEHLLVEPLTRFRAAYPGIQIELVIDNRLLSLTKREADIALRPTRRPPETLIGRRIGPLADAPYVAAGAGVTERSPSDLPWIAWEEGGGPPHYAAWLAQHAPPESIVYRSNSLLNHLTACRAGIGAALLPCFLGDSTSELKRLLPPLAGPQTELWLLTLRDLRRTARVRAVSDFLFNELKRLRPRLAGAA